MSIHSININRNLKYYFSTLEVMITFQIFANTFHSAALCDTGYLITFWITYLNHTRKENWTSRESVHFMFFILRVFGGALSIDAKRHILFTGRASIFAFLLLLLHYWGLCCEILQLNFFLKYYSNGTLNDCVFERVSFRVVMGNSHW